MIKTYEALFDDNNKGVYSISLVDDPAMEGNFVALSKDKKIEFKTVDEEQRILIGLVLEPNKPIYRNQEGEEFNIVFSEHTIKELSHNFFKQGYQTNSSIEHADQIKGVSFVESWIVEDSAIDKSANFGFSYPKGSWVATMKVDDEDVWNDYVKTGKVQGFSIDAFLTLKEVKLNSNNNNNKQMTEETKTSFNKLADVLMEALHLKKAEIKEEVVVDVKLAEDAPVDAPKEEEAPKEDAPKEDALSQEQVDAVNQLIESALSGFSEKANAESEEMKAEFSKENETLKAELVELKSQPAAPSINATVQQVELTVQGKLLKQLRENK